MRASSFYTAGVEAAALIGPCVVKGEYMSAHVNRPYASNANFHGWHVQGMYVLTGEHRSYDPKNGKFAGVNASKPTGAWEVAVRHSYLNLNDHDINGGAAHNTSLSLGWYATKHIRVVTNYIRSSVHAASATSSTAHRGINILGARLQVAW